MKNLHISKKNILPTSHCTRWDLSIILLSWLKKINIFPWRVTKFGSGWVIIIMDICFEMSLDLFWCDGISSHNISIKQNLFLTDWRSSCRSCQLNFLYYYVFYIAYVIICLLWNKFILLSHFTQIRRHSLHYHFNVMNKFYLITWNAHFYEGKKIRPSPFFRFKLLQGLNIISHVEDRKSSQQSVQSNIIKIW